MNIRNILISSGIFVIALFALIVYVIYTAITGTLDGTKIAMAFIILIFGFAAVIVVITLISAVGGRSGASAKSAELPKKGPMSYEKGDSQDYCPNCGANLGTNRPEICPECKERITRYL